LYKIESLTISRLENLEELTVRECGLKVLNIDNCSSINKINVYGNKLEDLTFLDNLNRNKLEEINLSCNNFAPNSLEIFKDFVNLREVIIGNVVF
jgi:hypothetical protein